MASINPLVLCLVSAAIGALVSEVVTRIGIAAKARKTENDLKASLERDIEIYKQDVERTKKDLQSSFEKKLRIQADHLDKVVQSRFAVRCKETNISAAVTDLDGNVEFTTQRKCLTTSPGLFLRFLDHFTSCTAPDAEKDESTLAATNLSDGVRMESRSDSANKVVVRFIFPDDATHSELGVDYGYRVKMRNAIVMTKEAVESAYKDQPVPNEYIFHDTEIPTDLLKMQVTFPAEYAVVFSAKVFLAKSWTLHESATKELHLQCEPTRAKLIVNKPLPGFRYLIQWDSPEAKNVERLRTRL